MAADHTNIVLINLDDVCYGGSLVIRLSTIYYYILLYS